MARPDEEIIREIRKKIFITGYKGKMAHLASCFSCLEMLYAFYLKGILRYDKSNPKWNERDRFILSKGHAGLALYAVLEEAGLITEEMFSSYLMDGAMIGGEPCMRDCEWVEATTGSLGHGLSMGLGMAMAMKSDKIDSKVYVMLGDGECEEGTIWETAMMASVMKLDNLVAILDCNKIQKMDFVDKTIGDPDWKAKWESFGWQVESVDGHDVDEFKKVIEGINCNGKPTLIIADTTKGKGVSLMEDNPQWHFRLPSKKELKIFMDELGITEAELE